MGLVHVISGLVPRLPTAWRDGSWYMLPHKQCHDRPIFWTWSLDQQDELGYLTTVLLLARGSHCLNQALHSSLFCVPFRAQVAHTRLTTADVTGVIKYTCLLFVAWGTGEQSYVTRKLCCYLHALLQLMVHTAVAQLPPPASCDKDHLPESREEHWQLGPWSCRPDGFLVVGTYTHRNLHTYIRTYIQHTCYVQRSTRSPFHCGPSTKQSNSPHYSPC